MKKLILFSNPVPEIIDDLLVQLFPAELENKVLAYMPCDGADEESNKKYTQPWIDRARDNNAVFNYIDNSKPKSDSSKQYQLILESNILVITGGNTYTLLRNIRRSGLDKAIIEFHNKDNHVIAGFSAGAIILTPNIGICEIEGFDENLVGLDDLTGLNFVDFEVFPHYKPEYEKYLKQRQNTTTNEVRTIADDEMIVTSS